MTVRELTEREIGELPLAARKYLQPEGTFLFSGIQAIVRMLFDKHRRDRRLGRHENATFISGYEGSPLGGLDMELLRAKSVFEHVGRIVHQPGMNEKLAMSAVYGSQFAGHVDGFWYGKAQGVKWIPDEGGLAAFSGTGEGSGAVILAGDDHQSKSSTFPGSSDLMLEDMFCPTFFPSSIDEIITLGLTAIEMSRFTGLYAGMKLLTPICDGAASVLVSPERQSITVPDAGRRLVFRPRVLAKPSLAIEQEIVEERLEEARRFARANTFNVISRWQGTEGKRLGFIVAGKTYTDLLLALCDIGCTLDDPLSMLKLGMTYPVEPQIVREFARDLDAIVVIEEKRDFIEKQVKSILYGHSTAAVWGKHGPNEEILLPAYGEITPETIVERLYPILREYLPGDRPFLETRHQEVLDVSLEGAGRGVPVRQPTYCSGCPHARSLKLPDGSESGGDIGCHTMEIMKEDPGRGVQWISSMGTGGGVNNGLFPFRDNRHVFQNLGDGTYFHSGRLAIASSVATGANITYRILYNGVVAMTGGQHPEGQLSVGSLVQELTGLGVVRTVVVSDRLTGDGGMEVVSRSDYEAVLRDIREVPGTTAVIFDQHCAADDRRQRSRSGAKRTEVLVVNEEVCEGCGDCARSLCPSLYPVETPLGEKTRIHQGSCNDDRHCLIGDCPSFMRVVSPGGPSAGTEDRDALVDPASIPEPANRMPSPGNFNVFVSGIGGTGVVSLSAMLAQAMILEGGYVNELNLTGLAQKGGAVESQIILNSTEQPIVNSVGARTADVYIACDSLHGLAPSSLRYMARGRTRIVANRSVVPTIDMIVDRNAVRPTADDLTAIWRDLAGPHAPQIVDAGDIVETLLPSHMFTNVFLLGVAYQAGYVPLKLESLEAAIRDGLRQPDGNIEAFHLGRLTVHDPDAVGALVAQREERTGGTILDRSLERYGALVERTFPHLGEALDRVEGFRRRLCDLIEYQDEAYARRYAEFVEVVYAEDPRRSKQLTARVARYLYKLMAYKDEYEVARLHLFRLDHASLPAVFGPKRGVSFWLLPPLLRGRLLKGKLRLPSWLARPSFKVLRRLRRLRGTRIDPFGWAGSRRLERRLIEWYTAEVGQAIRGVGSGGEYERALETAALPERIRGYEDVKTESIRAIPNRSLHELLDELGLGQEATRV